MPIKTNQEKATTDTKRRIKKKVKKYKKRNRANATLTPQVARNTRADAAKYPAYTPFAYRPADSPTHILKSKNDLIKIINQDLHNERIQTYELETDISRLQHQRDMAIKRKQELETTKRERLKQKLEAEHDQVVAQRTYELYKKDELAKHKKALFDAQLEADKALFDLKMDSEQQLINAKRHEETNRFNRERNVERQKAQLQADKLEHDRNLDDYKRTIEDFRWRGMYDYTDPQNPVLKHGAKQLKDKGVDFKYGERDLIRERNKFEIEKLIRETQREQDQLQHEISKYTTMNSVTNDPIRKQLEDRLAKQKRAYHAMQIMNERNAKSDKLRREISDIEHKTALLEASNLPPDAEFIRTRNQKLAELERVKQTKADTIEKIKLDRQIAEMNAQIGAISKLNQEIIDKKARVAELEQKRKSAVKMQQVDDALQKEEDERVKYSAFVDRLVDDVPWRHQMRDELRGMEDPTLKMKRMLNVLQRDTDYSRSIRSKAEELYQEIDSYRTGVQHEDDDEMYKGDYY